MHMWQKCNLLEKSVKTKKVNGNFDLKVSLHNTDRPNASCPETQNDLKQIKQLLATKLTPTIHIHKFKNRGYKTPKMLYEDT